MGKIKDAPAPLRRKLFLTGIIGAGCLLIGAAMSFILKDRIMLFLSLAVFAASVGKQSKVKIGYRYRFYFKETQHISLGSEYLNSAMSSDHFLGYEELGEFAAEATE